MTWIPEIFFRPGYHRSRARHVSYFRQAAASTRSTVERCHLVNLGEVFRGEVVLDVQEQEPALDRS